MALGTIKSVTILPIGAFADIVVEGMLPGGTYSFGLGPKNDPHKGVPTVIFSVTSQGFTNGVLVNKTRTVFGSVWVRKPFSFSGDEFTPQESVSGGDLTFRIALSESIYDSDNNTGGTGGNSGAVPTVTILGGLYTQGGNSSLPVTDLPVINNSSLAYPRVIGNISRPVAYEKVGSSWQVAVAAFHLHAMNGKEVDSVRFTASDSSGHTVSQLVTDATIDYEYGHATKDGEPICVIEHIANLNTSGFNQGDTGTLNYIVYPHIGNGASVLDTAGVTSGSIPGTGTASAPSPYYGPLSFVCDPAGTYCNSFAIVDPSGNDGTGAVGVGVLNPLSPPAAFATLAAAFTAIRTYNNTTYGRNNCGGATIFIRGSVAWVGGTIAVPGTRPACVLTVKKYPSDAKSSCVIATQSGGKHLGEVVKLQEITLTATNGVGVFDNATATSYLLFDTCDIDVSVTPTVYRVGVWHMTRCKVSNFAQGWANYGAVNSSPGLCRSVTILDSCTSLGNQQSYTLLGCLKTSPLQHNIGFSTVGSAPVRKNLIVAYSWITAGNTNSAIIRNSLTGGNDHGEAYVNLLVENCINSSQAIAISPDNSSGAANNILMRGISAFGQRLSVAYNEYGAIGYERLNWSIKNCLGDDFNIKADTFQGVNATATRVHAGGIVTVTVTCNGHQYLTGDQVYITQAVPVAYRANGLTITKLTDNTFTYSFASATDPGPITSILVAPHPNRILNWPVVYGTNCSGNLWAETSGVGAAGPFMPNFTGLSCLPATTTGEPPTAPTNAIGYLRLVNRRSFNGVTNGLGGGDYRLLADSPAIGLAMDWVTPYDLFGRRRRPYGASGAFEFESVSGLLLLRRRRRR